MNRSTLPLSEPIRTFAGIRGFGQVLDAYRTSGGVARGDDLARLLEDAPGADFASLGQLIESKTVFGFVCCHAFWIPMFQFDLFNLRVKPGPKHVLEELSDVFDGWELAIWFAQPNRWLDAKRPVEVLDSQLPAVREAAQVERCIAVCAWS